MPALIHAHPCNFRVVRVLDRGWGEFAFEYRWDSTGGVQEEDGGLSDLAHCFLYEVTRYAGNEGGWREGCYFPPDPPFAGWKFRDPTDGRTGPVGLERFSAAQGRAWDRHKLGGRLTIPSEVRSYTISAAQQYFFHCEACGLEAPVSGPDAGPHSIVRTFAPCRRDGTVAPAWRYSIEKHRSVAWLELDSNGCTGDSADTGFGPDWL